MQRHGLGVAAGQDKTGSLAQDGADGAEQISRLGSLIMGRHGAGAASGPAPGDLVLLADAGFVLPPDFYGLASRFLGGDFFQAGGEVFLNVSGASAACA